MMTPEVIRQYVEDKASAMRNMMPDPGSFEGFKLRADVLSAHRLLDPDGVLYEFEIRVFATAPTTDEAFTGLHNVIDLFSRSQKEGVPYLLKELNKYYPRLEAFSDDYSDEKVHGWYTNLTILSK